MVDANMFREYCPSILTSQIEMAKVREGGKPCACTKCSANTALGDTFKTAYDGRGKGDDDNWPEFEDTQLLLCSPRVLGYALDTKKWIQMSVDQIDEIPHQT